MDTIYEMECGEPLLMLGLVRDIPPPALPSQLEVQCAVLDSAEDDVLRARACLDRLMMVRRRLEAMLG